MVMVTCCDIMGKVVDADKSVCGHPNTMPAYYHYSYRDPAERTEQNRRSFSDDFRLLEHRIMDTLKSEILSPTPVEYMSECCPWFASFSAASPPTAAARQSELSNAETALFLCDAFVHGYSSAEYTCREIAAAATFIATEEERETSRSVPVTVGWETSTPQLRALWSTVSWMRSRELKRKINSHGTSVFNYSEGLRRFYAVRLLREADKRLALF
jgi:hypothetical protein